MKRDFIKKSKKTSLTYSIKNGSIVKLSRTAAVKPHKKVALTALKKLLKKV